MEKPALILQPSIFNAIIPSFVKNICYSILVVLGLRVLLFFPEALGLFTVPFALTLVSMIFLIIVFAILPLCVKIFFLNFTRYEFYKTHVSRVIQFIVIRKNTVPYSQISKIFVDISIWDRLCNAGDIFLHTSDDNAPDLVLHYIPQPEKVEASLYKVLGKR